MRSLGSGLLIAAAIATLAYAKPPAPLDSSSDRVAFRRWFSFLAESRYYARRTSRETPDAPALIRWSFKQALTDHGPAWSRVTELPILPHMPSVRQQPDQKLTLADRDIPRSHFVSRDLTDARPGDILRFRNTDAPASLMVYIGASQIVPSHALWVIYLAGPPRDGQALRVHRLRLETLLDDPCSDWRPLTDNPCFLGIWRFDLLGDDD